MCRVVQVKTKQPYELEMNMAGFDRAFSSALVILKLVFSKSGVPKNIVDIGGGAGAWLLAANQLGVGELTLVEGDWINKTTLNTEMFLIDNADLENTIPKYNKKFEICICVEVAEHLSPRRAESFVKELTGLSDKIVFSAAIPGQGGHGHLNERLKSYWINLFEKNGFGANNFISKIVWENSEVEAIYRQNIMYFEKGIPSEIEGTVDVVHPEILRHVRNAANSKNVFPFNRLIHIYANSKVMNLMQKVLFLKK
jgi:hypothetical protein